MSHSPDVVALLEQAYRIELDDAPWLEEVVAASAPLLQRGMGVFGFLYETMNVTAWSVGTVANSGAPPAIAEILRAVAPQSPPEMTRRFYWSQPCVSVLDLLGDGPGADFMRDVMMPHGAADTLMIKAADPTGVALSLCAPLPKRRALARPTMALWNKLVAHLAAAHRLRRTMRNATTLDAEAVLSPAGHCEHAEGIARAPDARAALRAAAIHIDRARGRMRREDPEAAVDLWHGLVAGRWSLVDHFDSDGRRYLVARRNDPRAPDPRALSERERQVACFVALGHANKLIAYELGISEASVATHVRRAAAKLGVASRVQLAERVQMVGGVESGPSTDDGSS